METVAECQSIVDQINALGGDVALVGEGDMPADMARYLRVQLALYERFEADLAARLWELAGRLTELRLEEGSALEKMPQIARLAVLSAVMMDGRKEIHTRTGEQVSVLGLLPEISNQQIQACEEGMLQ